MKTTLTLVTLTALVVAAAPRAALGQPAAPGKAEFLACPGRQPLVRLNLPPALRIGDLIGLVSSLSCRRFVVAPGVPINQVVSLHAPRLPTREQTYDLLIAGLDVVGLTVQPSRDVLRVVPRPPAP